MDSTEHRVRKVIGRTFGLPLAQVAPSLAMGDVPAWDSMGHMTLVASLEAEFDVTFPAYAIAELTSVPAIVEAIAELAL